MLIRDVEVKGFWGRAKATASFFTDVTQAVGKETGLTSNAPAIQQYFTSTCFSASTENLVLLEVVREPHWCNLVLYSRLQQIITSVGLPWDEIAKRCRQALRSAFKY